MRAINPSQKEGVGMKNTIEIQGVKIEVKERTEANDPYIPVVNNAYLWHRHTWSILQDILANIPVAASGHTGTGKSTTIEQIAARINQPCVRPVLSGQMAKSDLFGSKTANNGNISFVDGIVPMAMRKGWWLILDEMDFADPSILQALNSLFDPIPEGKQRHIILMDNDGERVEAHPDFRVFATANTIGVMEEFRHLYRGATLLNQAYLERFRIYHFDYLSEVDEIRVVSDTLDLPGDISKYLVKTAVLVREAFERQEVSQPFSMRRLFDWGTLILRHLERLRLSGKLSEASVKRIPIEAAEIAIFSRVSKEERKILEGIINRVFP